MTAQRSQAMWGGRFEGDSDPLFRAINDSLAVDWRLVRHDVAGSIAWARALSRANVLSADEAAKITDALLRIGAEAERIAVPPLDSGAEDVHSWVESRLIDLVGPLGKKLHTGRSRNDQVATDFRLFVREACTARIGEIAAAQSALVRLARREIATPLPGYTHLQRAQPVLFAHWCLAYNEMLSRDAARLADARRRAGHCPLGAAALAGTAYNIDRAALARDLGFDAPTANSLDAVSDRDFAAEALAALSLCAVHLSRLAEDLIVYSSAEFGFFTMSDSVASGSSLMPQKKNPDAAELVRSTCGRVFGAHVNLLMTIKGLPLSYNKDLQQDKAPLFDATDAMSLALRVLVPIFDGLTVNREACACAARGGHANATELADYLVEKGIPFRDAHDVAGRVVRRAIEQRRAIEELPLAELKGFAAQIDADVFERLSLESTLAKRDVYGGTAPARVGQAVAHAEQSAASAHALGRIAAQGVEVRDAAVADAEHIARIINHYAEHGLTIKRTAADLAAHVRDFTVAVIGGRVVGCGALVLSGSGVAELRSIAVDPDNTHRGVGEAVVRSLCADAQRVGASAVFVLTCSPKFFARAGFAIVERAALPSAVADAAWSRRDRSTHDWCFMTWEAPA